MGSRWSLRDIVDYELIATMALLDTAADRREAILRQIYEVNRQTVEDGRRTGSVSAILVPIENQHDPREAAHLVDRLQLAGVEAYRADVPFEADGQPYTAGTFVIPMAQVFARYAKDLLERQTYPEVRRGPNASPEPPYDVTAWSLAMLLGVDTVFVTQPLSNVKLTRLEGLPRVEGDVTGTGSGFGFTYRGPDTAIVINRLLKYGAKVTFDSSSHVAVNGAPRSKLEQFAKAFGLSVEAMRSPAPGAVDIVLKTPRIAMYQPWTGGSMDEGWTRWVLEQYEFGVTAIHNSDIKAGKLVTRDQHFGPGAILRVEVDTQHPIGYGVSPNTYGFYVNSPFSSILEGFASQTPRHRRTLSEHQRDRIRLAERRRLDVRKGRGRVDRHEPRTRRSVWTQAPTSRPDSRNVPAVVQRALLSAHDGPTATKPSN